MHLHCLCVIGNANAPYEVSEKEDYLERWISADLCELANEAFPHCYNPDLFPTHDANGLNKLIGLVWLGCNLHSRQTILLCNVAGALRIKTGNMPCLLLMIVSSTGLPP